MSAMAQISLPLPGSPVPITGQTLGALLIGGSLGMQLGVSSYLTYLAIGALGAPVFAGGVGGLAKISGATGGYLVGMALATAILGFGVKRAWDKKLITWLPVVVLAETAIFTIGVYWLHVSTSQSLSWSISKGFTPFILGEVIKVGIATTSLPFILKFVKGNK
jgi:biotin transport system substrate-specific component